VRTAAFIPLNARDGKPRAVSFHPLVTQTKRKSS
jgi:hypothetical protein